MKIPAPPRTAALCSFSDTGIFRLFGKAVMLNSLKRYLSRRVAANAGVVFQLEKIDSTALPVTRTYINYLP
jgi:hypothetical protein